ncbi:MAG TPA: hypothetical protein P5297_07530 [Bacilli bacterium]|jgi:hypothetical protein|nr:hypothetical protein [Bacilli bacterium]
MANESAPKEQKTVNPWAPLASWLVTLSPFEINLLSFVLASILTEGLSRKEQISVSILLRNVSVLLIAGVEQTDQTVINGYSQFG